MGQLSQHDRAEFTRYCRDLNGTKLHDAIEGESVYLKRNRWDLQARERFQIATYEMRSRRFVT